MKWYLFWEAIWHGLDNASIWLYLRLKFDRDQKHEWMLDFCYRQESCIRERRWSKYPKQSMQQIIDEIATDQQERTRNLLQEQARRGEHR